MLRRKKDESMVHNKEQQQELEYFKADIHFDKIKIETMQTDKMSETQARICQRIFLKKLNRNNKRCIYLK